MKQSVSIPQKRSLTSNKLASLPISLFGSVMGISGLALGWRLAEKVLKAPHWVAEGITLIAIIDFVVLFLAYLLKILYFPSKVKDEFLHPIAGNFFGTFTIALLLLSSVLAPYSRSIGNIIWVIGVVLTLAMAYISVSRLISVKQERLYATPAWIVPGVGVLDIPVTSGEVPYQWVHQINIMSFAIGSVWALILIILIFSRLLHEEELPRGLVPSLMILFAPFSVGFLGYVNGVAGQIDQFASILFYFGLFLFTVLYFKVFRLCLPSGPAWWGVSFPMAALANGSLIYAAGYKAWPFTYISIILLALVTITISVLFIRSLVQLFRGTYFGS